MTGSAGLFKIQGGHFEYFRGCIGGTGLTLSLFCC